MADQEMIDRVAKAIDNKLREGGSFSTNDLARSAIKAMREPTEKVMVILK